MIALSNGSQGPGAAVWARNTRKGISVLPDQKDMNAFLAGGPLNTGASRTAMDSILCAMRRAEGRGSDTTPRWITRVGRGGHEVHSDGRSWHCRLTHTIRRRARRRLRHRLRAACSQGRPSRTAWRCHRAYTAPHSRQAVRPLPGAYIPRTERPLLPCVPASR